MQAFPPINPHGKSPVVQCGKTAKFRDDVYGTYRSTRLLFAIGILAGLLLMVWTWARAASMSADGAHYMELARQAWQLGAPSGMDWYAGPGYPVLVGWLFGWIGDLDFSGRLVSFGFGLISLVGVGILSVRMFDRSVAFVAVGLLAVHTTFVRHAVMAETDVAYGCWLVWSILFVWELRHARSVRREATMAVMAAGTLGLGYLTRPEAVPLAGLLGVWYLASLPRGNSGFQSDSTESSRKSIANDSRRFPEGTLPDSPCGEMVRPIWRRLGWSAFIAILFLMIASPYLLELRAELGRWSLSGKERSIVLKFVPDKKNFEEVLKLGVSGAVLSRPSNIIRWLPYHIYWGGPQFVKSLSPIILIFAAIGLVRRRRVHRAPGAVPLLLWVSVPFILFFFLTFPGRRYFMQAMPQWTILAAIGAIELAHWIARRRLVNTVRRVGDGWQRTGSRAFRLALLAPLLLLTASTLWGNRTPIETSLLTERRIGERILEIAGPGRRVLTFTVAAFYAQADRVPLWGPMQGIVRCHGYGNPLSYDDLVEFVRRNHVDYVVLDADLQADCPEFFDRVRPEEFELVADDITDQHGTHFVFRAISPAASPHAN